MGQLFKECNREQMYLMPPSLKEWLPEGHLCYFLLELVEQMDLKEIIHYYTFNDKGAAKAASGQPAYDPRMMTSLLLYGYARGVVSSRKVARAVEEDLGFRVIAANESPDFHTISEFRRKHLKALRGLFPQVLMICCEAGLVKLGHVALDGTKVKANASKHKAMSYGRMKEKEKELREVVDKWFREAEETDAEEDRRYGKNCRGDELPEELRTKEKRLKKIQEALRTLEEEARQKAIEKGRLTPSGEAIKKRGGKDPKNPPGIPPEKAQKNFTDPESRIMKGADKAFVQAYNCQAAVDSEHQIIVAESTSNQPDDKQHAVPMKEEIKKNLNQLPKQMSQDAGYYQDKNVESLEREGIDVYISPDQLKHGEAQIPVRGRIPKGITTEDRMRRKLRTKRGRDIYSLRKETAEPTFGQIKGKGLRQFLLRGLGKVGGEWSLWCMGHNLTKLWRIKGEVCPHWFKKVQWTSGYT